MRLIMNLHQIKFSGLLLLTMLAALSFIHVAGSFGQGAILQLGTLKGTVRGYDEKPIAGASITVEPSGGRGAVQSNDAGEFEIPLPAGTYNVLVQKSGYASSKYLAMQIAFGFPTVLKAYLSLPSINRDPPVDPVKRRKPKRQKARSRVRRITSHSSGARIAQPSSVSLGA